MNEGIYISINPESMNKIIKGIKNNEFRNYIPKSGFTLLYVYETAPTGKLKYVIEIGEIVSYPDKIEEEGDGNTDFNNGKKTKYAYSISKVEELVNPISLRELKEKFGFLPPQAFSYGKRYPNLTAYIEITEKKLVIER
jgi:predicted transcriptional regulator